MNAVAGAADSKGPPAPYRASLYASKSDAIRSPETIETPATLAQREAGLSEREPMDWPAIASVLGERISLPIALLDRFGRIRFFNSAMEEALGWTRHEVEGTPWTRVCPMPETEAARWLEQALRG